MLACRFPDYNTKTKLDVPFRYYCISFILNLLQAQISARFWNYFKTIRLFGGFSVKLF